jgi:hypothetical protein
MLWIPVIYLGIGFLVSLGAGIYALTLRDKRAFNPETTAIVFLVYLPLLWPMHLYRIVRDIWFRKFKR